MQADTSQVEPPSHLGATPRVGVYARVKRGLDLACALALLVLLAPLMLVIALAVKIDSRGPALFRQIRIGAAKSRFEMLKYRTMSVDAPSDVPTHQLHGAETHITGVGRILRRTSLDELPQLINILRGDMSFVGPRPALWNQEDLIAERDRYGANEVRPGLTGLAQVSGRDELPIPLKAELDGQYVKDMSLRSDLRYLLRTFRVVASSEGIVEGTVPTHAPGDH